MPPTIRAVSRPSILVFLLMAITCLVYWTGLHGDFVFDDTNILLTNRSLQIRSLSLADLETAALSGEAGQLKRPISMLTFALNFYVAGSFNPFSFKLVNLIIHLLTGLALYFFLTHLFAARGGETRDGADSHPDYRPLAITALWLLHPLALTSVLYVVQRMNSLSALFTLCGLILYIRGRTQLDAGQPRRGLALILTGIVGFGAMASLSKENGLLTPYFALVVEAAIFRFRSSTARTRQYILLIFFLTAIVPALVVTGYSLINPDWILGTYKIRSFTLLERVLTETRVLWSYMLWIVAPVNSSLGLFHDDIPVSTGLLTPPTTLLSILGLIAFAGIALAARTRHPLVAFGIAWFLVGHSMESSVLALEMVHEHRNYLPMVGILTAVVPVAADLATRIRYRHAAIAMALVACGYLGSVTLSRAFTWSNNTLLFLTEARHHPDSARINYEAGRQYALLYSRDTSRQDLYERARTHLLRDRDLDPRSTNGLFGLVYLATMRGEPASPDILNELQRRLRSTFFSGFVMQALDGVAGGQGAPPKLPHQEILHLHDAVLANPNLRAQDRGMALASLSLYYSNYRRDFREAERLAQKAIAADPGRATFHVSYANLLIALKRFDEAQSELRVARQLDKHGLHAAEIDKNFKLLSTLGQPATGAGHRPGTRP